MAEAGGGEGDRNYEERNSRVMAGAVKAEGKETI